MKKEDAYIKNELGKLSSKEKKEFYKRLEKSYTEGKKLYAKSVNLTSVPTKTVQL